MLTVTDGTGCFLKITNEMVKYIELQRTGYGADVDIEKCYEKDIQKDYDSIKSYLPETCSRILDIGCGLAGIDLFLYNHYNGTPELRLLDYSKIDEKIHYGYQNVGSVYNNLELSAQFLKLNGVDKKKIGIHNAAVSFPYYKYDIIISLLSCGFHYPVRTYLKHILDTKSGIVILDIRKHSNQIPLLNDNFNTVQMIAEYSKCERYLLK